MSRVEWLEAMIEGAGEGLMVLAPSGEVLAANARAGRLIDVSREPVARTVAADAVRSRRRVSVLHTSGDGAKLLVSAEPLVSAGRVRGAVVTIQDVTELGRMVTSVTRTGPGRARETAARPADPRRPGEAVIGDGPAMRAARALAARYAAVDSTVLLLGETGTGKGVFARLIHEASARAAGPFVEVNCGALPEGMIEAELFGYAPGAFTGAQARGKPGLVEVAHGGTLLLDEIGELPPALQVKLLRFLDDGRIWPLGAVRPQQPDVRVLAATNRDLESLVERGGFRGDLYYRINVLRLRLPPLRERREDIPALVAMMLERLGSRRGAPLTLAPAAAAALAAHPLPGNVRELWNIVERLAVTGECELDEAPAADAAPSPAPVPRPPELRRALQEVEAAILRETLRQYGSQSLAAAHLGVSQATVARRARQYGLTRSTRRQSTGTLPR